MSAPVYNSTLLHFLIQLINFWWKIFLLCRVRTRVSWFTFRCAIAASKPWVLSSPEENRQFWRESNISSSWAILWAQLCGLLDLVLERRTWILFVLASCRETVAYSETPMPVCCLICFPKFISLYLRTWLQILFEFEALSIYVRTLR